MIPITRSVSARKACRRVLALSLAVLGSIAASGFSFLTATARAADDHGSAQAEAAAEKKADQAAEAGKGAAAGDSAKHAKPAQGRKQGHKKTGQDRVMEQKGAAESQPGAGMPEKH